MANRNAGETEPLISVIVPVYKVEDTLDRCVSSIVHQTYKNLQIILVDDGSPDNCPEMCDEWAKKDNRIKVIHQKNGGLSAARNAGLDICAGRYIAFVDSDDYVDSRFIELLYRSLRQNNAKLAFCKVDSVRGTLDASKFDSERTISLEECYENAAHWEFLVAWDKLYDASLWKNVRYPAGRIHEDEYVFHYIYGQCEYVAYIPDVLYHYTENENGIMHASVSPKRLDLCVALSNRINYFVENGYVRAVPNAVNLIGGALYSIAPLLSSGAVSKKDVEATLTNARSILMSQVSELSFAQKIKFCLVIHHPLIYMRMKTLRQSKGMQ